MNSKEPPFRSRISVVIERGDGLFGKNASVSQTFPSESSKVRAAEGREGLGEGGIRCEMQSRQIVTERREKLPPDREAITEEVESVASVSESLLGREHVRTSSNIAMTVIAALINAEPAASRQPASRHPDVDVALPSSPASSERLQGEGEKSEEEEGRLELEITRRWKIGDAIKEEGILEIRWVGGKSKKPPLPSSFPLPSFLLTLHLRVLFAAE